MTSTKADEPVSQNVEEIFRLSAAQRLWLLHSLRAGTAAGVTQSRAVLEGGLDRTDFRQAWNRVVERHGALRTSLHWEDLDRPVQVVRRRTPLEIEWVDGRHLAPHRREEEFEALLEADRQRGFDLNRAPLMRLLLFRTTDTEHRLVWTLHHSMLDGWSASLVLDEAMENYRILRSGGIVRRPDAPRFRDYVIWESRQDRSPAEAHWRNLLAGVRPRPPVAVLGSFEPLDGHRVVELSADLAEQLRLLCRRLRVTPSILLQGVVGLAVAYWARRDEAVIGLTVSGRTAEVPDLEDAVGLFATTVPARIPCSPDRSVGSWLRQIQSDFLDGTPFHFHPPQSVHSGDEIDGRGLFDVVLVTENQRGSRRHDSADRGELTITELDGDIVSRAPINLVAILAPRFELRCRYHGSAVSPEAIDWLIESLESLLLEIVRDDDPLMADLLGTLEPAPPLEVAAPSERPAAGSRQQVTSGPPDAMASIWCEILGVEQIGERDNFFELGGTSLAATQLIERIEGELGLAIDLSDLVFQTFDQVRASARDLSSSRQTDG